MRRRIISKHNYAGKYVRFGKFVKIGHESRRGQKMHTPAGMFTKLSYDVEYVTNFNAPDAHFDYSSLFSDAQVEKVGNPEKSEN
jgi:hypothetical protein